MESKDFIFNEVSGFGNGDDGVGLFTTSGGHLLMKIKIKINCFINGE